MHKFIHFILYTSTLCFASEEQKQWAFMGTEYMENNGSGYHESQLNITRIEEYIKGSLEELWLDVSENFRQTPVKRKEPRDKAYYNDKLLDHACPFTIRKTRGPLRHRIPDVIGIGFAKCGTGALAFLDCHPTTTFRTTEPRFFLKEKLLDKIILWNETNNIDQIEKYSNTYAKMLPMVADDEILISKSPQYAGGTPRIREKRARAMKIMNPNVKLIALTCDPSRRAYSQLSMKSRRTQYKIADGRQVQNCRACLKGTLDEAVQSFTRTMQLTRKRGATSGYANFGSYIRSFLDHFKQNEIMIGDGENLIKNPNEEWSRILDFLQIKNENFHFEKIEEKGFPCLVKPVPFCLNKAKGTSRKENIFEKYKYDTHQWGLTFKPSITDSMSIFGYNNVNNFCQNQNITRFEWTRRYVC